MRFAQFSQRQGEVKPVGRMVRADFYRFIKEGDGFVMHAPRLSNQSQKIEYVRVFRRCFQYLPVKLFRLGKSSVLVEL